MYVVGGAGAAVSNYAGVDDIVVVRVRDHNGGLADEFIAGRGELGWYTGEVEFLGVGEGGEAIRGCGIGEEAQSTGEVARVDTAIALVGIGCQCKERDDEEVGEMQYGWVCEEILRVKRALILIDGL